MNETQLKQKVMNFVCHKLGTSMYINSFGHKKGTNKINISLGYSLPRVVYDDEQKKQFIKFVKFDDIVQLTFSINTSGEVYTEYDLKVIFETIDKRKYRLQRRIEKIILDEIYPKLFDVPLLQNKFRPIYNILNHIWISNKFTHGDWFSYRERDKLMKYLTFLENLEMIRKDKNNDYVMGNIPTELKHALRKGSDVEVLKSLFGYSLKEGRKYLKEELHVPMVDVYIEIISAYYYLASKVNKSVKLTADTFYEEFRSIYDKSRVHKTKFFAYLTDLTEAKILQRSDNFYMGDDKVLKALTQSY